MFVAIKSDIVNDVSGKLSSRVCANRIRYFKAEHNIFQNPKYMYFVPKPNEALITGFFTTFISNISNVSAYPWLWK